eukprot:PhF_6_TR27976/c0_g2_i1/m.41399
MAVPLIAPLPSETNNNNTPQRLGQVGIGQVLAGASTSGVTGEGQNVFTSGNGIKVGQSFLSVNYLTDDLLLNVFDQHVIRKINLNTGTLMTLAGTAGSTGTQDGICALFNGPKFANFKVHSASTVYLWIPDRNNHRVRTYNFNTGSVATYSGSIVGNQNNVDRSIAQFNTPNGYDFARNVGYLAEDQNSQITRLSYISGLVTQMFTIDYPYTVSIYRSYLFIAIANVHDVKYATIPSGTVQTFIGGAQGDSLTTGNVLFDWVGAGVVADGSRRSIFVAEGVGNQVKEVNIETLTATRVIGFTGASGTDIGPKPASLYNVQPIYPRPYRSVLYMTSQYYIVIVGLSGTPASGQAGVTRTNTVPGPVVAGPPVAGPPSPPPTPPPNDGVWIGTESPGNAGENAVASQTTTASLPNGLAVNPLDFTFYFAENLNCRIRKVHPTTYVVTTVYGSASQAAVGNTLNCGYTFNVNPLLAVVPGVCALHTKVIGSNLKMFIMPQFSFRMLAWDITANTNSVFYGTGSTSDSVNVIAGPTTNSGSLSQITSDKARIYFTERDFGIKCISTMSLLITRIITPTPGASFLEGLAGYRGYMYYTEGQHVIRKVSKFAGVSFVFKGTVGVSGASTVLGSETFNNPWRMYMDCRRRTLFIHEWHGHRALKIEATSSG